MADRSVRSLLHLAANASTARTLNLISVWNKHGEEEDYKAHPFFESPVLNRCIIFVETAEYGALVQSVLMEDALVSQHQRVAMLLEVVLLEQSFRGFPGTKKFPTLGSINSFRISRWPSVNDFYRVCKALEHPCWSGRPPSPGTPGVMGRATTMRGRSPSATSATI